MTAKKRRVKLAKPVKAWALKINGKLGTWCIQMSKGDFSVPDPAYEWVRVEIRELPKGKK